MEVGITKEHTPFVFSHAIEFMLITNYSNEVSCPKIENRREYWK